MVLGRKTLIWKMKNPRKRTAGSPGKNTHFCWTRENHLNQTHLFMTLGFQDVSFPGVVFGLQTSPFRRGVGCGRPGQDPSFVAPLLPR